MTSPTRQIFLLKPFGDRPPPGGQTNDTMESNLSDVNDFTKVCRICATVTKFVVPIYNLDGALNEMARKINLYLPIQVRESDELPLVLCCQCVNTVLAWDDLVQTCTRADTALRARLAAVRAAPAPRLVHGCPRILPLPRRRAEVPSTSTNEAGQNQRDMWNKHESDPAPYGDTSAFATDDELDAEDDQPLSSIVHKKTDPFTNFYKALVNFRNHVVNEHLAQKPEYSVSSDSEIVSGEENETDEENMDTYDDLTQYNMRKDRLDEETRKELNQIQIKINGKVFYKCQICGKNLSSSHTYIFHKRIHTGERPCVCHICGKQFRAPNGLQRHLTETHYRARRHSCRLCFKDFANTQNLKQHLRVHTGEKPFVCPQCGKRFTQSGSLHVHLRSHSEQCPHQCAECGAAFRLRASLARHRLKHTGERPHVCVHCGKTFRQRNDLKNHAVSHTDLKPFNCVICGAAFRQRRTLRHHTKGVHEANAPPRDITHPLTYTHVPNYQ